MKLKSQLRDCPLELLRSICEFWHLRPEEEGVWEDAEQLGAHLYPRLQSPAHFKHAFERLEVSEREIIYFLALHGGELPVEEFRRRCGLHEDERMAEVSLKLGSRGFLWRESVADEDLAFDLIGLPDPFVRLVDLPPYWKGFLGHYLQELGLPELKAIARRAIGYKFAGTKKQALVHHLRNQLLEPQTLQNCLDQQTAPERELFQQILRKNGACVWRDLLDGGVQKKFNHVKAELLEQLTQTSGLIYVWLAGPNKYNNMVMAPRDLGHIIQNGFRRDERTLDELSRSSEKHRVLRGTALPHPNVIIDNSQNILRDLAIFLALVRRSRIKMLNNGGIGRNDLKKIVPHLSHNKTPKYVAFLALFAMSRKLLIPMGDHWRVSKNAAPWLGATRQAYRELYEFWLESNEWNEEFIDGDVVHVDAYPHNLVSITELRKLVLRVLEKMPTETWTDFETLAESLLPQVAIEIPGRFDHSPAERNNRHTILILESILAESLYWLGLVVLGVADLDSARELGGRPNESLAAFDIGQTATASWVSSGGYSFCFRPSGPARQLFGGRYLEPAHLSPARDERPPDGGFFTVQPNHEIVTPPDLNLDRFYQLLAFADVRKVDIMTTLVITRESLRMGMEQGLKQAEMIDFLRAGSRRDLPETIVGLIEECGARHGEVDVGLAGGYVMTTDPLHVEELRANPRILRYIKDVFNERLVLLSRTVDLKKVTRELEKMGFVPHVASDTLHVTGEGLFNLTLRPEEYYELLAVLQFAMFLEEEHGGPIFEDRLRALLERLSHDIEGDLGTHYFIEPLLNTFRKNYDKMVSKQKDEEKRKLKKQVNRLLTRIPRNKEPEKYAGENPTSDPQGVVKLLKFAADHELQVKIHYVRSTGDEIDEVIEPESIKGERLYAFCQDQGEHHIYYVKRIASAAI